MTEKPDIINELTAQLQRIGKRKADLGKLAEAAGITSKRMVFLYFKRSSVPSWEMGCRLAELIGLKIEVKGKQMKFEMKHAAGNRIDQVKSKFETDSVIELANYMVGAFSDQGDNYNAQIIFDVEQAAQQWGDEAPAELMEKLKSGPVLEIVSPYGEVAEYHDLPNDLTQRAHAVIKLLESTAWCHDFLINVELQK